MSLLEENIKNMKWPKKGLKIFKSDFDWWNNASVDYYQTVEKLSIYEEGYKEAGDIVSKYVNENKFFQDALIYPIVFLYRHYIELALKDIIGNVKKLLKGEYEIPTGHDINRLWNEAKEFLKQIDETNNPKELAVVEDILKQLSKQDPTSETFRYHIYKNGNATIRNLTSINIRNLSEVVDALHSYFFGVQSFIGEALNSVE